MIKLVTGFVTLATFVMSPIAVHSLTPTFSAGGGEEEVAAEILPLWTRAILIRLRQGCRFHSQAAAHRSGLRHSRIQLVRGDSPLVAAVSLIPMALTLMPSARVVAPRLSVHLGAMRVSILGLALVAAGLLVLSRLDGGSSYWLLFTGLVLLGAGMGLAMTPATAAITDALPVAKQGVGSAVNDLARELGGALGIAVLGSVLNSTYRSHLDPTGVTEPLAEQARSSLAMASRLGPVVESQAQHAFVEGMQLALGCAAAVVALTAVAVVALLQRPDIQPHTTDIDRMGADATADALAPQRLAQTRSPGCREVPRGVTR